MLSTEPADSGSGMAALVVVDASGSEVWRYESELISIAPSEQPRDDTEHLFLGYAPGNVLGVIVLAPSASGFDDFGSLPPPGEFIPGQFDAGFLPATAVDVDGDGTLELQISSNDCVPNCAAGSTTNQSFRWDGSDYVGD